MLAALLLVFGIVYLAYAGFVLLMTVRYRSHGDTAIAYIHAGFLLAVGILGVLAYALRSTSPYFIVIGVLLITDALLRTVFRRFANPS